MEGSDTEPSAPSVPDNSGNGGQNPSRTPSEPRSARSGSRITMAITIVFIVIGLLASFYVYGLSLSLEQRMADDSASGASETAPEADSENAGEFRMIEVEPPSGMAAPALQ